MNTICTSACGNDYDCPHEYDEVTLKVQHDTGERKFEAHVVTPFEMWDAAADEALGYIVEQEQKWGEERAANQD